MSDHTPVRVLHIAGTVAPGGIENFLMNLHEKADQTRFTFDYAVHVRSANDYGERIKALGGTVYELPRLSAHPAGNLKAIRELVRENRYDVVIRHTPNAMVTPQLIAAKNAGAKTVLHAHSATDPMQAAHYAGRALTGRASDLRIACSERAGKWMFGNRTFTVVKNAIDIDRFAYSRDKEARIRDEFFVPHAHLYGSIGNFRVEKNHLYLLEAFRTIREHDPDAVLLCIGDGPLKGEIEKKIAENGLTDSVILAGTRGDVRDVMSAMDVLLFPSTYEGLPMTLIEAQAASLPVLVSDRVAKDIVATEGLLEFLSIDENPAVWAEHAADMMKRVAETEKDKIRVTQKETLAAYGYDIHAACRAYQELIGSLV